MTIDRSTLRSGAKF